MTEIQTYTNAAFGSVRILYEDGKPLFCGADACKALGYSNQRDALNRHCRYVVKRDVPHPQSVSKTVTMNFLPEGDLYRLITHSKLPRAEKFERWVFDEVLPTIRKSGMYGADPAELERLRQNNQLLREWFCLLADRKRDLVDIQQSLAKARKGRDDAKAQYMAAKASYGKMCDYVRSFEDLALRVQNEINNCIDQIQIVALATPSMDETLNTMLDEMAQQMLAAGNK